MNLPASTIGLGPRIAVFLLAVFLASACASMSASVSPGTSLENYKTFYVANHGNDTRGIEKMIAQELRSRGFDATSGLAPGKPDQVDVLVTYEDKWQWDMTNYLLNLTIEMHDPNSNELLASGQSYRPSLQRKSPEFMVQEIVQKIFTQGTEQEQ